jgi:translocator assembly and maintenance protein 41
MLDIVLAVEDPLAWHSANLQRNPTHYSWVRHFGPSAVVRVQDLAASVYYNCTWPSLKYGVISTSRLIQDLQQWQTLYIAGRMQKPVAYWSGVG